MHKLGHNKQGEKLGYDAKAATRFVKAVSVGDVQWHSGVAFVPLRFHGQSFLLHQVYLLWLYLLWLHLLGLCLLLPTLPPHRPPPTLTHPSGYTRYARWWRWSPRAHVAPHRPTPSSPR